MASTASGSQAPNRFHQKANTRTLSLLVGGSPGAIPALMRPDEGGGGTDAGGGGGAPASREIDLEGHSSFTSLLGSFRPLQLPPGDDGGDASGDGGNTAAARTRDSEDLVSFNG
jgi:hypothetical protein